MLKIFQGNNIKILLLIVFSSSLIFAQPIDEKKRKEHQAVKDYMERMMSTAPKGIPNTDPDLIKKPKDLGEKIYKSNTHETRKSYFMNGNKVQTEIYNYGGIAPGQGLIRGINNVVWRGIDYVFQFSPIIGASVPDANDPSRRIHVISDGLKEYDQYIERSPTGELWQWEPLPGFSDPTQDKMASNPAEDLDGDGKPDSWPREWYNPTLGRYVWPGYLQQDVSNAELEVFWGMDDRHNTEFSYFPFENDPTRKGLGVQIDGRALQWSNALAENAIFFVYTVTNTSDKDLDSVFFGIYGDPDVGGASPFNDNNLGFFIPPYAEDGSVDDIPVYARSLVYFWNTTGQGRGGVKTGYIGCKFLESPSNSTDGIDNDGDGMIDESQFDGIDNDGDWNPDTDDVGIDGIAGTEDEGEGDGVPTAGIRLPDGSLHPLFPGEPNFELTDLDEADQIGLTSFNSWVWGEDAVKNDESMWARSIPGNFGAIQSEPADLVFVFGSGYISLKKGETKRFSMALLLGETLDDLLITSETVQTIYNQNYRFFKPPATPSVTAVPGDKKVTLYWDTIAEESIDPITGKDFEGYVIYRSTDPSFSDIQTITDGKGSRFLSTPLKKLDGTEAKWDLDNDWKGYHPIPYQERGIQYFLGNNSGLVHSYVDSNEVINGQTYYYAVVAYDHGDSIGIPPTETPKNITIDPITSRLQFDKNTVQVTPGPRSSGYQGPVISNMDIIHKSGNATGSINVEVLNDMAVIDNGEYQISFSDTLREGETKTLRKNYSILRVNPLSESFILYETKFTKLRNENISAEYPITVQGSDANGNTVTFTQHADYVVDHAKGSIRRTEGSSMPDESTYSITYQYYPIYQSTRMKLEDSNPVIDGMLVTVLDDSLLQINTEQTKWVEGNTNYTFSVQRGSLSGATPYPANYEIIFSSNYIDSTYVLVANQLRKVPAKFTVRKTDGTIERVETFLAEQIATRDSLLSHNEEIIIFKPNLPPLATNLTWGIIFRDTTAERTGIPPADGDVLQIVTKRPFTKDDSFSFKTEGAKYNQEKAAGNLDNIYVVPNPYVGMNAIEPTTKLPGQQRGERRIYFENLPPKCTIRIYTLSGELVQILEHESTIESGREYWNLLNRDGFGVAYGVYFAHIDAKELGEKVLKFALIK
jgi:hypothetical protein